MEGTYLSTPHDRFVPAERNNVATFNVTEKFIGNPDYIRYHRPFIATGGPNDGRACVVINGKDRFGNQEWTTNKGVKERVIRQHRVVDLLTDGDPNVPIWALNATSFRRDDWIQIEKEVEEPFRDRLKLVGVLQSKVSVGGFNGWGKMSYEYDAMSDAHSAQMDMDGLTEGKNDGPLFLPLSVPLAFTHSDFWYSDRLLAAFRANGGPGLDTYSAEQAGRRVAELVEDTAIGIKTGLTWGGRANYFAHDLASTWFGLLNYTNRNTKTNFTAPTTGGWVPNTAYNEILAAFQTLFSDNVYGPFAIFYSTEWDTYFQQVFAVTGGNNPGETLTTMLMKNKDVTAVERLDRLTGLTAGNTYTILIQALDKKYVRFINGMGPTTWQWDTRGGMQKNFKVGVVQVTLPMSDYSGKSGTLHGTTA